MSDWPDEPNVGKAVALEMGREWVRLDAAEWLISALGWLQKGGSLTAVADRLRTIAVSLEEGDANPLAALSYRLEKQHEELEAIVAARVGTAA